jgi:hypothetical protein
MRTWFRSRCWAAFSPLLLVVVARMSLLQSARKYFSKRASAHKQIGPRRCDINPSSAFDCAAAPGKSQDG